MTLAETASVFGEELVFRYAIRTESEIAVPISERIASVVTLEPSPR